MRGEIKSYLHGVQGVVCSNHTVPTKITKKVFSNQLSKVRLHQHLSMGYSSNTIN